MSRKPWSQQAREESEWIEKALAAVIVALILAVILGFTFFVRAKAPCWVFPLKEAPTRCLPGAER